MKGRELLGKFQNWLAKFMPYGVNIMEQESDYIILTVPETSEIGLAGKALYNKAKVEFAAFDGREVLGVITIDTNWTQTDYEDVVAATEEANAEIDEMCENGPMGFLMKLAEVAQNDTEDEEGDEWIGAEDEDTGEDDIPESLAAMLVQLLREALDEEA